MKRKCLLKKFLCGALAFGMLLQCPQAVYAQEDTSAVTETEPKQDDTRQTGDTEQPDGIQTTDNTQGGDTQQPDGSQTADDTQQPDDNTQQPDDTEQPDDTPEELPCPDTVTGLRTTKTGKNKVVVAWNASEHASEYEVYRKIKGKSYKQLLVTKKTQYCDKSIQDGKTYVYKVVAINEQKKAKKAAQITFSNVKAVQITSQKYTHSQMQKDMQELQAIYADYCQVTKIGESVQGRGIYDFAIGNPDAKESLLVVSTLHAREYICSAIMMKELQYYLENYNQTIGGVTPAKTLNKIQIHYIVMANPDGVTISQTKYPTWKSNGRGVDLNRNFPTKKFVAGGKPGAQSYSGKKALSEPESQAVANLTKKLLKNQKLQGVINYHAMGRIIYGDCTKKSIKKDTTTMYNIARKNTGYVMAPVSGGGKSWGGQYREYVMDLLNLPSITIEVGSSPAPCPYWQYETEFQKNKYVVLQTAKALQ